MCASQDGLESKINLSIVNIVKIIINLLRVSTIVGKLLTVSAKEITDLMRMVIQVTATMYVCMGGKIHK